MQGFVGGSTGNRRPEFRRHAISGPQEAGDGRSVRVVSERRVEERLWREASGGGGDLPGFHFWLIH